MVGLIRRRQVTVVWIAAVVTAVLVLSTGGASAAAGSTMRVKGPVSNKIGTVFTEKVSGRAAGAANFVVAWEQFYKEGGCARTYAAESTRTFLPGTYDLTLQVDQPVSRHAAYSIGMSFGAAHAGVHGVCAYLINLSTGKTYAHAARWWKNHN